MKTCNYAIILNDELKEAFDAIEEAVMVNRTKYPVNSKVFKINPDGTRILMAKNVSVNSFKTNHSRLELMFGGLCCNPKTCS